MTKKLSPLALVFILSGVFFAVFLLISGAVFISKPSGGKLEKATGALFGKGDVGILEMNGVIMDSKKTIKQLESFEKDDDVKAVVLRLNSPGGAVAPSQEIYQAVKNFKKPLIVSMSSVAASGAYYIACGAKKVYANPGTITGSIGVIMEFANLKKLYDWAKIERYSIKTGKFKDAGAEYREMTPEERALLQGMVDDVLVQFKEAVSKGRGLSMAQVDAIADGRVFSGSQAKANKLVDEVGTLHDAVLAVAAEAKIKGEPHLVYPEKPKHKIWEYLMDDESKDEESSSRVGLAPAAIGWLRQLVLGTTTGVDSEVISEPGVYWLWGAGR